MMRSIPNLRELFVCLMLAIPGVVVPVGPAMCLHGTDYGLGWPFASSSLSIGHQRIQTWHVAVYLSSGVLLAVPLWLTAVLLGRKTRAWALSRQTWQAAASRSVITFSYVLLVFYFVTGIFHVGWDVRMELLPRQPEVSHQVALAAFYASVRFGRACLPYLYSAGALAIVLPFAHDGKSVLGWHRGFGAVFAVFAVLVLVRDARFEYQSFNHAVEFVQRRQAREASQ